ncbi:hypothetical protein H70357_31795 [Paenibacillus sp. FSL H7-0357]|uniref:TetR/AcrR family transcriptional regulator n=1 Tax=unclassified Paenibacillus TaxID=185978 RepID=UPI0004F74288|nr:TetR/AcrR family transcriptional regulator [Paenibacillus sp. FSL H7-0357]AIQ20736.1 hypothetical protein H70357_31795 [Paenibacillus sp. FSL H7-0357]
MNDQWKEQLELHRTKRREVIIMEAKRLFLEKGLSAVTLKEIVEACGISKVTYYKYFRSLDEIIFEVQMDMLKSFMKEINAVPLKGDCGFEKLTNLLARTMEVSQLHSSYIRFIAAFDHYYTESYPTTELEERFRMFVQRGQPFYVLIQEGIKDGSIRLDIDAKVLTYTLSNMFLATLQRLTVRGKLLHQDQGVDPAIIMKQAIEVMLAYLKPIK